jgi:ribosomal-protein-alanine N-acetyltransferase
MITDIPTRLATLEDADAIATLSRDLIEHGLPWGWRPERIRRAIRASDTNVAVVGPQGAPIGFGIMEYQEDEAHLLLFAVAAEHQRKGVGSALLQWLEDVARVAGVQRIRLEVRRENDPARCFYNEHGYHELVIEKGLYRRKVDGIRLEKRLSQLSSAPSR